MRCARALLLAAGLLLLARDPAAAVEALVLHHTGDGATLATRLMGTGLFTAVDERDGLAGTPSLSDLLPYDSVLVYGADAPLFPDTLGDVLATFVDEGHRVVLATYGFSDPFAVQGAIMGPGYAPLQNAGANGDVTGQISVVSGHEADPLFAGVTISGVGYFHNANYAHPTLDTGATLLAQDQSSTPVDMVARSANGRVVSLNIFPDEVSGTPLSDDGLRLFANALVYQAAESVLVSMTATQPDCGGAVTSGTAVCPVESGTSFSVVFALDAATAIQGYQLELRWDASELAFGSATQLFPDSATPVAFTSAPSDPATSVASASVTPDPASTTLLFQLDFVATPAANDGQPDLWWLPQGAGLSPTSVVIGNPAGAAFDVTLPPVVPALPAALVPVLLVALLAGALPVLGGQRRPSATRR